METAEEVKTEKYFKAVGYWAPGHESFPDPASLIAPEWCRAERPRIASYLRAGQIAANSLGYAACRLCGGTLGSADLTDGEWVWPQGLEHYVLTHEVRLPNEFIAAMRRNDWRVSCDPMPEAPDSWLGFGYWVAWAAAVREGSAEATCLVRFASEVERVEAAERLRRTRMREGLARAATQRQQDYLELLDRERRQEQERKAKHQKILRELLLSSKAPPSL